MQGGIARQPKDIVDAVLFAPRHRLWTAIMAIAAQGDVGVRPVAADATDEPANMPATSAPDGVLPVRNSIATGRPVAVVIDMDRQEAAFAMMAVPERQLLHAVNDVDGIVDVERNGARRRGIARAIDVDQRDRSGRKISRVVGAFSQRDMVGWLARPIGPSGRLPSASLKPGSWRSVSRSSASS